MKKLVLRICVLLLALLFLSCACMQQEKEYLMVDDLDDECYELSGEAISIDDLHEIAEKLNKSSIYWLPINLKSKGILCSGSLENDIIPMISDCMIRSTKIIEIENSEYTVFRCEFFLNSRVFSMECYFLGEEMLIPQYATMFNRLDYGLDYITEFGKTWAILADSPSHGSGFGSVRTRWFCIEDRKIELEYCSRLADSDRVASEGWADFYSTVSDLRITHVKKGIFECILPIEVELRIINNDVVLDPLKHSYEITLLYDTEAGMFSVKEAPIGYFISGGDDFNKELSYVSGASRRFRYLLLQEEFESLPSDLDPNLQEVVDIYYESFTNTTEEGCS